MTHPYLQHAKRPRVLAHRGLVPAGSAGRIAENSFAAIAAAQAAGAVYVESDCHLTADGVVVLFHDASLLRVAGDPRLVSEVTSAELAALMSDKGGLATLAQALESFPSLRFNIDVKSDPVAVPAGKLIADHADRVLVTSFDDARRLRAVRAATGRKGRPATSAGQRLMLALLLATALRMRRRTDRLFAEVDALQIPQRVGIVPVLSKRLLQQAHRHQVEVHVWTINDPLEMQRLVAAGVDGIVTDHADLALDVLR